MMPEILRRWIQVALYITKAGTSSHILGGPSRCIVIMLSIAWQLLVGMSISCLDDSWLKGPNGGDVA